MSGAPITQGTDPAVSVVSAVSSSMLFQEPGCQKGQPLIVVASPLGPATMYKVRRTSVAVENHYGHLASATGQCSGSGAGALDSPPGPPYEYSGRCSTPSSRPGIGSCTNVSCGSVCQPRASKNARPKPVSGLADNSRVTPRSWRVPAAPASQSRY